MKKILLIAFLSFSMLIHGQSLEKGYHGFTDIGYTYNLSKVDPTAIEIMTSHGYQFCPYFFLGAGLGFEFMNKFEKGEIKGCPYTKRDASVDIPIFLNARINITKTKFSPFFDGKIGAFINNNCGIYANASLGCRYSIAKNKGIYISVGYEIHGAQYQQIDIFSYGNSLYYINKEGDSIDGLTAKVGFDF